MKPIPLHLFVNHAVDAVLVFVLLVLLGVPLYLALRRRSLSRSLDV
jgi:hypothetical protein